MLVVRTWLEYSVSCKTRDFNRKAPTPICPAVWADVAQSNRRLMLQSLEKCHKTLSLDPASRQYEDPNARRRDG